MIVTDHLARRLEAAEAVDAAGCAEAACAVDEDCAPVVQAIAGGVLSFCGASSPLTHAIGIGMHGPVTEDDIDAIEDFFVSRAAPVAVDVCPHADPSLREILTRRGYRINDMNNVMVRTIEAPRSAVSASVEICVASDADTFSHTVITGFFGREHITSEEFRLGRILFHMPSALPLLAFADGRTAGGCGLSIRNGIANFYGDAVLPAFRNRGIHATMITDRLRRAADAGCEFATAGTTPGSTSHRNYARMGFEVAYTKLTMVSG